MTTIDTAALWDTLDGLCAYDLGARDSGIHDEDLRERTTAMLAALDPAERRLLLGRMVREHMLSDDSLRSGYGLVDVKEFLQWLLYELGVDP